jgi:hypothetical protein
MATNDTQLPLTVAPPAHGALASEVEAALTTASDGQLRRVVGVLDSMIARGTADQLLASVRPRISALQLSRPLRFGRLLSLPLEGALVNAEDWDRDQAGIPRATLPPIIGAVRYALGSEAELIEMKACGHTTREPELVAELGRRLWRRAAAATLPEVPTGWTKTGVETEAAPAILALCRDLWRQASA